MYVCLTEDVDRLKLGGGSGSLELVGSGSGVSQAHCRECRVIRQLSDMAAAND